MEVWTGEEYLDMTEFDISSVFYNIPENFFVKKVNVRYYLWISLRSENPTFAPSLRKEFCCLTVLGKDKEAVDSKVNEIQQEIYRNYMSAMRLLKKVSSIKKLHNTHIGVIGSTAQMLCDNTEDLDILVITSEKEFEEAMKLAGRIYKEYLPTQNKTEIEIDIGVITREKMRKAMEGNTTKGIIYAKYLDEIINPYDKGVELIKNDFRDTPAFERYKFLERSVIERRNEIRKETGF